MHHTTQYILYTRAIYTFLPVKWVGSTNIPMEKIRKKIHPSMHSIDNQRYNILSSPIASYSISYERFCYDYSIISKTFIIIVVSFFVCTCPYAWGIVDCMFRFEIFHISFNVNITKRKLVPFLGRCASFCISAYSIQYLTDASICYLYHYLILLPLS